MFYEFFTKCLFCKKQNCRMYHRIFQTIKRIEKLKDYSTDVGISHVGFKILIKLQKFVSRIINVYFFFII